MNQSENLSNNLNLLKEPINYGIISLDSVHESIMASKREQIRKIHPYAITPPTKDGGRWQTCYKDSNGNRKNIKAQTCDELLDKLIPIYSDQMNLDKTTFFDLFNEWLEYKKQLPIVRILSYVTNSITKNICKKTVCMI